MQNPSGMAWPYTFNRSIFVSPDYKPLVHKTLDDGTLAAILCNFSNKARQLAREGRFNCLFLYSITYPGSTEMGPERLGSETCPRVY